MYKFYDGPIYFAPTRKADGSYILNKSSPKAPPPPDYKGAAEATAASNMEATKYQTNANRANQVTPWGSLTWSRAPGSGSSTTFDQARYDADMAAYNQRKAQASQRNPYGSNNLGLYGQSDMGIGADNMPWGRQSYGGGFNEVAPDRNNYYTTTADDGSGWEQKMTLTPEAQAALDSQLRVQMNQSKLAEGLQGQVAEMMKTGFVGPDLAEYMKNVGTVGNFDPNAYGTIEDFKYTGDATPKFNEAWRQQGIDAAYNKATMLEEPGWRQQTKEIDTQLRLQGLTPGTEAYNNAMQNLLQTHGQARAMASNNAILTGTEMANRDFQSALAGQQNQYAQALSGYVTNRDSQNQRYTQGFNGFNMNMQAQDQRFRQGQSGYQTAYTAALQKYLQPLNNMNAVLNGNQVATPQFTQYAQSANPGGTDYSGATNALGQWNQGVYNRDAANAQAGNNGLMAAAGTIGAAFI